MTPLPPGPPQAPVVQVYRYGADPVGFFERCAARYGDCFTMRLPRMPPMVVFRRPDAVRDLTSLTAEQASAGAASAPLEFLLGRRSLLLLEGARHARERRLMLPPFHGERLRAYADAMRAVTDRAIDRFREGDRVELHGIAQEITLEVIIECIFGLPPGDARARLTARLGEMLAAASTPLWMMLPAVLPGGALRRFLVRRVAPLADAAARLPLRLPVPAGALARCLREIDRELYADIAARRARGAAGRTDVVSMLIEARDEHGVGLDDDDLRDEMLTLLFAGHETTATTLAFAVAALLEHPAVAAEVRAELERVLGGGAVTAAHVPELKYLDATIRETLRLWGPAPSIVRELRAPARIGGRDLPAGVIASASLYLLHRDPELYPDPERFDPTRFLNRKYRAHEYAPFGGSPRTCLGMAFALFELKVMLATLVRRTTLEPVGAAPTLAPRGILLGPSHAVPVVVRARRASATPTA